MTESKFLKELEMAVAVRKVGYERMEKLASNMPTTESLSLDEPLSVNKSVSVRAAFCLDTKWEHHKSIVEAFRRFQLDPNKPWHWRLLIEAFIEAGLKRPGPKTKTVSNKYSELSSHIDELKCEDPNLKSYSEIARRLRSHKRYRKHYAAIKPRTLRSHVSTLDWGSIEENLHEIRKTITKSGLSKPTKRMRR